MPLIAHNDMPTFERLNAEGRLVLPKDRAAHQDIRELHIGLLNLMQDKALHATERQFFRLIGESNQIAQFYVHPFTLPEVERSEATQDYIQKYYEPIDKIKENGLDALIITGTNVADPDLSQAPFWGSLQDIMGWAWQNVTSTITACLATHAVAEFQYGQKRNALEQKRWGIYKSRVRDRNHPLVQGMNTVFDVPHSRNNDISWDQFEAADMRILVNSFAGGVHLATSPDGFRQICFQGHQEYDTVSLLKEYRREVERFIAGERADYPPAPEHYFSAEAMEVAQAYHHQIIKGHTALEFPENKLTELIENTWTDSGRAIIANWMGKVYQTTNMERTKQFMDGINPDDPLGLKP